MIRHNSQRSISLFTVRIERAFNLSQWHANWWYSKRCGQGRRDPLSYKFSGEEESFDGFVITWFRGRLELNCEFVDFSSSWANVGESPSLVFGQVWMNSGLRTWWLRLDDSIEDEDERRFLFIYLFFDLLDRANGCWMNHFFKIFTRWSLFFFLSLVEVVICMMQCTGCLLQREIRIKCVFNA